MNNTVENDFFEFPKVKWLHLTGEMDKSVTCVKFTQDLTCQKSLKSVNFFLDTVYVILYGMPSSYTYLL